MTEIIMIAHMFTALVIIITTLLVLMFKAVFSRPSNDCSHDSSDNGSSRVPNTLLAIESLSPGCWKYDVFLSFRGEDVRKNFVDHLYTALVGQTVLTYKDDETLLRGDTIGPALSKAIQESRIALIVFSKNYADSSWCLDELAYIMKCKEEREQIVIPIFYDVDPSDVRKQKGQFGKAFSKHMLANNEKVESWKKTLVDASNIAGWETNIVANGHEAKCIKEIVGSVLDKLASLNSAVDDDDELVGMVTRLQDLKSQLEVGSGGVRMVGIWGVGGGGKTTLATSLYMKISADFSSCCFVDNVREESRKLGLIKLQEKILSTVFNKEIKVESVHIGKQKIKQLLCSRNLLVVLDDVDDLEQLEALAGRHNWFGDGSRIIITTRDEHVLARVDKVCPVTLLSHDEATRLFRKHAYREVNPVEDYDELSSGVLKYVKGLPLALKVLGSFLYDKDKNGWLGALDKLNKTPNPTVTDQLKISYDGLEPYEKELFLDITCLFRGRSEQSAMGILDACGFHPHIGLPVLKQKSLITVSKFGELDMHDLVREMGYHIIRGEDPDNPETHSRVWRNEDIENLCAWNATTENHMIEAIHYHTYSNAPQSFTTLVSNLKKLRFLEVWGFNERGDEGATFLSNDLKYILFNGYPSSPFSFPECFQLRKLVILRLCYTRQKELWKDKKNLPCLKELELKHVDALVRTPDFAGLPCLQNLIIKNCESLEEIHPSLGNHTSLVNLHVSSCNKLARFPTIVRMEKLEIIKISDCKALLEIPQSNKVSVHENLPCLKELEITHVDALVRTPDFGGLPCLRNLIINKCESLEEIHPSLGNHTSLVNLHVSSCNKLARFPTIVRMEKLEIIKISDCKALLEIPQSNKVSVHENLPSLKVLEITHVDALVRTPDFGGLPCLQKVTFSQCESLEEIHPSIGSNPNLVYMCVHRCPMLTRCPTIFRMEKLKNLKLSFYGALLEFPRIIANMDSLENLDLNLSGIEVLPSSVGRYCTNLISLKLHNCSNLKTIEGNFHALKRLEKFELYGYTKLEKFSKDLFDVKCCLKELRFRVFGELNMFPPSPPHLPYLLRKLNLSLCELKDGEIPPEIGELSGLKELYLDYNNFSRVDINLSQLTQLKLLSLVYCEMLVELPELPPNLAILKANNCNSLNLIGDDTCSKCKCLCSFSVTGGGKFSCGKFSGGKRLLESMFQGSAIENGQCMSLILKGIEIPKEFEPPLLRGSRYKLQLPENWFNEYTGFLFCSVFEGHAPDSLEIFMRLEEKFVQGDGKMGMGGSQDRLVFREDLYEKEGKRRGMVMGGSQDKLVFWEDLYEKERKRRGKKHTLVVYVSFGSIKNTVWWDQTSTAAVDFFIQALRADGHPCRIHESFISGFGVRLVSKKNQKQETTQNSSFEFFDDDGDYKYKVQFRCDYSMYGWTCRLGLF